VQLAGVRGAVWCRPYHEAQRGGDIHYLSVCGQAILSKVVLADVSGHGLESAEVSRIIHAALVESIGAHDNSTMLYQVNEAFLSRRTGPFKFTTMASMIFDSRDRSLVYAYAGHPSILRGDATTGRFSAVRPAEGPRANLPLGLLHGTSFRQNHAQLAAGDVLVTYSDAITESRGADGELLGEAGLIRLLERADTRDPATLKGRLLERLGGRFEDDASLIVLQVT